MFQEPVFDEKYKVILKCEFTDDFYKKVWWIDDNSNKSVDVRIIGPEYMISAIYFAFEDPDDALLFKIRFKT